MDIQGLYWLVEKYNTLKRALMMARHNTTYKEVMKTLANLVMKVLMQLMGRKRLRLGLLRKSNPNQTKGPK